MAAAHDAFGAWLASTSFLTELEEATSHAGTRPSEDPTGSKALGDLLGQLDGMPHASAFHLSEVMGSLAVYQSSGSSEQRLRVLKSLWGHLCRMHALQPHGTLQTVHDTLAVGFGLASVLRMWDCPAAALRVLQNLEGHVRYVTRPRAAADSAQSKPVADSDCACGQHTTRPGLASQDVVSGCSLLIGYRGLRRKLAAELWHPGGPT